jgi:hypothetical protein
MLRFYANRIPNPNDNFRISLKNVGSLRVLFYKSQGWDRKHSKIERISEDYESYRYILNGTRKQLKTWLSSPTLHDSLALKHIGGRVQAGGRFKSKTTFRTVINVSPAGRAIKVFCSRRRRRTFDIWSKWRNIEETIGQMEDKRDPARRALTFIPSREFTISDRNNSGNKPQNTMPRGNCTPTRTN